MYTVNKIPSLLPLPLTLRLVVSPIKQTFSFFNINIPLIPPSHTNVWKVMEKQRLFRTQGLLGASSRGARVHIGGNKWATVLGGRSHHGVLNNIFRALYAEQYESTNFVIQMLAAAFKNSEYFVQKKERKFALHRETDSQQRQ